MKLGERVLVTGGAGFIGTVLAQRFAAHSQAWVVYDNLLDQVHGPFPQLNLPSGTDLVVADIRDDSALAHSVAQLQPDVVVHLAAETGTGQSLDEPKRHTDVNVNGTAVLLQALAQSLPARLVLASSRAVYGEGPWLDGGGRIQHPGPRTARMLADARWQWPGWRPMPSQARRTCPSPVNIYGATKLAQENLITAWTAAKDVGCSILRLQNVYGPGQSPLNPYTGITTRFIQVARDDQPIPVYEDGEITRDFVFIDDVARAIGNAATATTDVLADCGTGVPTTIAEMARICASLFDAPAPIVTGQYRLGDVRSATCDMTGSRWIFGGEETLSLTDGLRRLADWI